MGERRVLVIGSQCEALKPPLSFLPNLAKDLYEVLTDKDRGGCVPVLPEKDSPLLNRGVDETRSAIIKAFSSI